METFFRTVTALPGGANVLFCQVGLAFVEVDPAEGVPGCEQKHGSAEGLRIDAGKDGLCGLGFEDIDGFAGAAFGQGKVGVVASEASGLVRSSGCGHCPHR